MKEFKIISNPIKLIFLDIDGVLNTGNFIHHQWLKYNKTHPYNFQKNWCPIATGNLNILLNKFPDLYLVISSTWRLSYPNGSNWIELVTNIDPTMQRIIGITPSIDHWRETEIDHYLNHTANKIESFCIIDDDIKDLKKHRDTRLVNVTFEHGLTSAKTEEVITILNHKLP